MITCVRFIFGIDYNFNVVFELKKPNWEFFSSVTSVRGIFGLGIINNILFAVVGFNSKTTRKMPNMNTDSEWTQINHLTVITVGYDRYFDVSKISLCSVNENKIRNILFAYAMQRL